MLAFVLFIVAMWLLFGTGMLAFMQWVRGKGYRASTQFIIVIIGPINLIIFALAALTILADMMSLRKEEINKEN